MKILSNYDLHPANYSKPTPVTLKKVADFLLATILIVDPLIISIPDFPQKEWVLWIWNAFAVLFKFVSKMVTEKI
jgi:hypothetical protein